MTHFSNIVCKPTSWVKVRVLLIFVMFSVFAYLFYHDGTVGYREKNQQYLMHEVFVGVAQKEVEHVAGEAEWETFVAESILPAGDEEALPLPEGFDRTQKWPASLSGAYEKLKKESNHGHTLWLDYAAERGWDAKVMDHPEDTASLKTQMGMAYGSGALALIVLVIGLRIISRQMLVTESSYIAPGGVEVPFTSMRRIDVRKWDSKGIASIDYEVDGQKKSCKVDGMVYGQFKQADGAPAEKLFQHILANFKGELIAYEEENESEADESVEVKGA